MLTRSCSSGVEEGVRRGESVGTAKCVVGGGDSPVTWALGAVGAARPGICARSTPTSTTLCGLCYGASWARVGVSLREARVGRGGGRGRTPSSEQWKWRRQHNTEPVCSWPPVEEGVSAVVASLRLRGNHSKPAVWCAAWPAPEALQPTAAIAGTIGGRRCDR